MYVEFYILDNLIMNLLILRLAACMLGVKPVFWRITLCSSLGAVYALSALFIPWLLSPALKILLCFLMALGLPLQGIKNIFLQAGAVAISTFATGGLTYALALLTGGGFESGFLVASIPIRILLYTATVLTLLPNVIRRIRRKSIGLTLEMQVIIEHDGRTIYLNGLIDTGNSLRDPLTGMPGVLISCPPLYKYANSPVICHGAFSSNILYGFKPDSIKISGQDVSAFVFIADSQVQFSGGEFTALIPLDALPISYKNNSEEVKCKTNSGCLSSNWFKRFLATLSKAAAYFTSAPAKRFRHH